MPAVLITAGVVLLLLIVLTLRYSILIPPKKGLVVLMYHNVSEGREDGLTIPVEKLELQLMYLKEKKYRCLTFPELKELSDRKEQLPPQSVILTFDDAYRNLSRLVLPLLEKYGFRATVFVPVAFMGKYNHWDQGAEPILDAEECRRIVMRGQADMGLHSFLHRSYGEMTLRDMEEDLNNCFETMKSHQIPFVRALALPYGGFPRKDKILFGQMTDLFRRQGIDFGLRIGNRINRWPIRQPYLISRIDIRGDDPMFIFRIKLKKGKAKLFT